MKSAVSSSAWLRINAVAARGGLSRSGQEGGLNPNSEIEEPRNTRKAKVPSEKPRSHRFKQQGRVLCSTRGQRASSLRASARLGAALQLVRPALGGPSPGASVPASASATTAKFPSAPNAIPSMPCHVLLSSAASASRETFTTCTTPRPKGQTHRLAPLAQGSEIIPTLFAHAFSTLKATGHLEKIRLTSTLRCGEVPPQHR